MLQRIRRWIEKFAEWSYLNNALSWWDVVLVGTWVVIMVVFWLAHLLIKQN